MTRHTKTLLKHHIYTIIVEYSVIFHSTTCSPHICHRFSPHIKKHPHQPPNYPTTTIPITILHLLSTICLTYPIPIYYFLPCVVVLHSFTSKLIAILLGGTYLLEYKELAVGTNCKYVLHVRKYCKIFYFYLSLVVCRSLYVPIFHGHT